MIQGSRFPVVLLPETHRFWAGWPRFVSILQWNKAGHPPCCKDAQNFRTNLGPCNGSQNLLCSWVENIFAKKLERYVDGNLMLFLVCFQFYTCSLLVKILFNLTFCNDSIFFPELLADCIELGRSTRLAMNVAHLCESGDYGLTVKVCSGYQ